MVLVELVVVFCSPVHQSSVVDVVIFHSPDKVEPDELSSYQSSSAVVDFVSHHVVEGYVGLSSLKGDFQEADASSS